MNITSGSKDTNVNNVNDAPILAVPLPDQVAEEDKLFQLSIPSSMFHDVDVADTLTWSVTRGDATALPAWLVFDPLTGMLSGTPGSNDTGTLDVKITVTEVGKIDPISAFDTIDINVVAINHAPTLGLPIGPQTATEDQPFSLQIPAITFSDTDVGDVLTFAATNLDGTPLPSWLGFDGTTGVGEGLLANRPATCTTGVGYWATDQGSWNQIGEDGLFYRCTSTNTWAAYYTPYDYPHPLTST